MNNFFEKIWDYQTKILHCDLLNCFMFHDKKSCRKTMFLSFIVGGVSFVCITFVSWIQ